MSIRRLPEHLVNRIAAGEVVERPASALKELVENAIDAGATRIAIRLAGGGIDRIEVADDGCGMSPADMALALERHATSKLPDDAIERGRHAWLSRRGAALDRQRRPADHREPGARRRRLALGRRSMARWRARGRPRFRPAPGSGSRTCSPRCRRAASSCARTRSEYAACLDVVKRLAMARPDIGFTLEHDGRRILSVQPGEDRPARVAALTDREPRRQQRRASTMPAGRARLGGVAGLPTFNRGVADHQYLFVNGRPVKDRLLIGAVRAAYQRPARPRPPPGARPVHRPSRRGGRRQRPPGQDRGPLPRSRRQSAA